MSSSSQLEDNSPDPKAEMMAYALGLKASGLWLEWGKYAKTEEGTRTVRQLRKHFIDCQGECLGREKTARSLSDFKLCLQKLFPEEETDNLLKSIHHHKQVLSNMAGEQKTRKNKFSRRGVGAAGRENSQQITKKKSLKFRNIK